MTAIDVRGPQISPGVREMTATQSAPSVADTNAATTPEAIASRPSAVTDSAPTASTWDRPTTATAAEPLSAANATLGARTLPATFSIPPPALTAGIGRLRIWCDDSPMHEA